MTDKGVTLRWRDSLLWAILVMVVALPGCVTKESYTQQVNRTTNLQRLLADEERHSSDLNAEVARLKNLVGDLEAQNKLVSDQLKDARTQVVRSLEEVGRLQEEVHSHRANVKAKRQGVAPAPTEPPDRLGELQFETLGANKRPAKSSRAMATEKNGADSHEVQRGDTLFNIAKRYKTDVKTLKELNGLTSDNIRLGERLMVSGK